MLWKRRGRARESLDEIARRVGGEVGEGLVISSAIKQDFRYTLRFRRGAHKIRCSANRHLLWFDLGGTSSGIVFSVGREDQMVGTELDSAVPSLSRDLPVFTQAAEQSRAKAREWLTSEGAAAVLGSLSLRRGDSLHVCTNAIALYLTPRGDDENWQFIDELIEFASLLPPTEPMPLAEGEELIDGEPFDIRRLPEEFHRLLPYLRKWAIGDDEDRTDKQAEATTEELEQLYAAVSPHFAAIDAYLEKVWSGEIPEDPDRYESALLQSLAECAAEAEVELDERRDGHTEAQDAR